MKLFLSCFISLLFFIPYIHNVRAEEVYKITDPMVISPPPVRGVGRVIWSKMFTYDRHDVPVFLSANPDKTGSMNVGDYIQFFVTYIGSLDTKTFNYNASPDCKTHAPLTPTDLSNYFPWKGGYNVLVRILDWCGATEPISSMYFVDGAINPGPRPFLDLPWNYAGQGLSFDDAALAMTAYFDHSYPLLSLGQAEPREAQNLVTTFENEVTLQKPYSSHDGYDFARLAGARIGEPVLAAAPGIATFIDDCAACGNMIEINHGNGYQTRYLHLQKDDLLIDQPGVPMPVTDRQAIGKVGATGNVYPSGELGAHLHFMVVHDKNNDGNFDDNVPDGIVDPFGWRSDQKDPWTDYAFSLNNMSKTGDRSYYLFKSPLTQVTGNLTSQGEVFVVHNFTFNFPNGATSQNISLNMHLSPTTKISNLITSIGPSVVAMAKDALNNNVTKLENSFTLHVKFGSFDLSAYKKESISLYSSEDGTTWSKEPTQVDFNRGEATAQVNHLSYFALFGERSDTVAPQTLALLHGQRGQDSWYRSDVLLELQSSDNPDGSGIDYTLYKLNGGDWQTYVSPITFTSAGHYSVSYYSVDKSENIEEVKNIDFDIDKQIPEIMMKYDPDVRDIIFKGLDDNIVTVSTNFLGRYPEVVASDQAGNQLAMILKEKIGGNNAKVNVRSLTYNSANSIILQENSFNISSNPEDSMSKKLDEFFNIGDSQFIKLQYRLSTNETMILEQGRDKVMKVGMKLLQISTKNGTLIYTY